MLVPPTEDFSDALINRTVVGLQNQNLNSVSKAAIPTPLFLNGSLLTRVATAEDLAPDATRRGAI